LAELVTPDVVKHLAVALELLEMAPERLETQLQV
jgi:hypothetical protein